MERNLTTGSVFHAVVRFSLPYLLSYFLQTLYGMADLYIIGLFCGTESSTAVSVGSQVMHVLTVILVGVAMGTTVLVGRSVGAGRERDTAAAVGNTVTLFGILSCALTALLLFCVSPIVSVLSTPLQAVEGTVRYLSVCFCGIPFITAYNVISAICRGLGDTKTPLKFVGVACVTNIALDFLFIGGFALGTAGAALGTVISQAVSVLSALLFLRRSKLLPPIRRADFRPERGTMRALLWVGIPVAVQDGLIQLAFIAITVFANRRGLDDAAAVGVVEKIIGILFLIPSTMLSTVSAVGAQNFGAGKPDRARKTLRYAVCIALGWGFLVTVVMQIAAEPFVSLFLRDGGEAVRLGGQYMRGYVMDCMLAGVHFCFSGYFCALGKSLVPFVHNLLSMMCVRIPVAYWASVTFADTLFPMGLASTAGSVLSVAICVGVYLVWRHRDLANK
ncbi:MAG: MATE family efflux transporter [Clostridiales bacterium]|nr:MATE family efflux transporter [Clostridiales bacterium]